MKPIIFTLLILSVSLFVKSSFLDNLYGKFTEITSYFYKAIEEVGDGVKKFFVRRFLDDHGARRHESLPVESEIKYIDAEKLKLQKKLEDKVLIGDVHQDGNTARSNNPVISAASPDAAIWYGKHVDSHIVKTKDGYILTVHRITRHLKVLANQTVLLHHGFLGSSTDWILLGLNHSLPYILSDAGYDVWLTNARGNYHSQGHICMTPDNTNFWKFSWQEMGEFDMPAVIDYIRKVKEITEPINFIGHSMGATALLVLLSTQPQYNEYLRLGILLAPLVFMDHVKGPMKVMSTFSEELLKLLGDGELLPSKKVPGWLASKYCKGPKIYCRNPLLFLSGFHEDQAVNTSFITEMLYHTPAGGSTATLLHYVQVAHNGKFHKFNEPDSEFPLKNITLPIALVSSSNDWLATIPDVLKLYVSLLNPIDHHLIKTKHFTHSDFVWGANAKVLVFDKIMEYLNGQPSSRLNENEVFNYV